MVRLYDVERNTLVGEINDDQLQFLVDELEEESADDQDYYISAEVLEGLAESGGDPELIALLRTALGSRAGIEIRWERE